MRCGNLLVVSGPAGAGKGTLVSRLSDRVSDVWVSVSATTRAPRPGEEDGVHYFFYDDAQFDRAVAEGGMLEWAHVHGHRYGTPRATVEQKMAEGRQVVLEIDVQGAFQVREMIPQAKLIFIEPPSLEVLEARLRGRGTEAEDEVIRRMKTAEVELSRKMEYDVQLVNDDLDQATDTLVALVNTYAEQD
ncbi:MAG TPA: guanylate kinase [Candidatus Aveggerthella stercoripullorum]|uniref:Guanylate kinase n=1 Tax=Candidatus Aveggerthella stercoripullorum TaxID=2840688 RepID=A0A9D1A0B3_9ACTN|nr:guanylate kinase [Candidatus Aveggerthella stercoripullorum]